MMACHSTPITTIKLLPAERITSYVQKTYEILNQLYRIFIPQTYQHHAVGDVGFGQHLEKVQAARPVSEQLFLLLLLVGLSLVSLPEDVGQDLIQAVHFTIAHIRIRTFILQRRKQNQYDNSDGLTGLVGIDLNGSLGASTPGACDFVTGC